ncbi:MAG: anti-sigma factor [Acidobacteria bacterium]|nr:anti-sigma factor [Acidobacteriota bacterium]
MTSTAHDELRDLSGLYVLGALTADERATFEEHLRSCAECKAEIVSLGPVVGALALAVPRLEAPADLRPRLLSQVSGRAPSATIPVERPDPAVRWADVAGWLAAAAAIFVAVVLAGYSVRLRDRVTRLEGQLTEMTLQAVMADRQVTEIRRTAAEARSTLGILAAPDLARVELAGQKVAPRARARAFWSRARGLVFTATDLPPLPAGKVYQLWVVTRQAPISAGLLTPDTAGQITAVIETPPDLPSPIAMAVTLEPAGGVPAPTGDKYLVGVPAAGL